MRHGQIINKTKESRGQFRVKNNKKAPMQASGREDSAQG